MALGTPVAGATAYNSAAGTTTVAPAYPSGILATDVVLLFVGQKPSTANSGTVTTPTGWTLRDELTAAGGYGTTLGADTGNTNLRVYSWDAPVAGQTGTLSVTLGTNNISWAFMVRIPTGGGAISYGSADGQRTTQPTSPMSIALTNGATATNFQSGDLAIWAMCIPTDVTTPGQFSAQSITASGATFGTATELNEPDSGTNNDIGGYSAYASVSSGSSTAAPTVTATLTGTLTNVRGPVVLLRVREAPVAQDLTPDLFTNTQAFHNPTVVQEQFLTPALFTNDQTFFSADVTQSGGAQNLAPGLYTNAQTFYAATATATRTLTAARYDNAHTFYSPALTTSNTLAPDLYANSNAFYAPALSLNATLTVSPVENTSVFYSPVVTTGALAVAPSRLDNAQTFYSATVTPGAVTLSASRVENAQTFYSATVASGASFVYPPRLDNGQTFFAPSVTASVGLSAARYDNTQDFYAPAVTTATTLTAARLDNAQAFYAPTVSDTPPQEISFPDWVAPGWVEPGWVAWPYFNANQFFAATVTQGQAPQPQPQTQGGGAPFRFVPFNPVSPRRPKRKRDEELCLI